MSNFDGQITFCYTDDLEAATAFYEGRLGLTCVLDQGTCRIYAVAHGAFLGFCRRDDAPRPDGVILTFVTDDVDGWYARLISAGVTFEQAPAHNDRFGIYHCFVRDPAGYLVEIQRFDDPRWTRSHASPD